MNLKKNKHFDPRFAFPGRLGKKTKTGAVSTTVTGNEQYKLGGSKFKKANVSQYQAKVVNIGQKPIKESATWKGTIPGQFAGKK